MDRFLLRGTFLVFASLLLGYLVVRERRLRAESALLARALGRVQVGSRMDQALGAMLREIAVLYEPLKALVALRTGDVQEVFSWQTQHSPGKQQLGTVRTVLQFSKLEAAAFSFPAHTWYYWLRPRWLRRVPTILALDVLGRRVSAVNSAELLSCFPASEIPFLMATSFSLGEEWNARLILVRPSLRGDAGEGLRFLQRLVRQIGPAVQNICFLRDVRKSAEDQVRARLTRELHDLTIQSLLGAEMQIEVLRRQSASPSSEFQLRLAGLQSLIHRETLNLRDLASSQVSAGSVGPNGQGRSPRNIISTRRGSTF